MKQTIANAARLAMISATAICALSPILHGQNWTGGPTGPIYYNGGNVGIGTTSPTSMLDVYSTSLSGAFINLETPGTTSAQHVGLQLVTRADGNSLGSTANNSGWQVDARGNNWASGQANEFSVNYYNGTSWLQPFAILPSGNVGIGTTSPAYKLSVNGTIGAKQVIVTNTGWPDHVFAPDYRLWKLNEVAAYIAENHHLPDIPSEAEVREKGVNLGDIQSKLLAKVEELTLHMIREHERNNRLEEKNQQLQERIAHLEAGTAH